LCPCFDTDGLRGSCRRSVGVATGMSVRIDGHYVFDACAKAAEYFVLQFVVDGCTTGFTSRLKDEDES